ncbi:response regulator transcription factor [Shewanella sp. MBTL60-112-B2]|uniref:response regulator transcription factor n=2 Tax=unclassified Shewanella TaxID=196818 RepID=UPI001BC2CC5C|nr:helix-turn-helix transcriptional regulator [Shewanella sp. MBTL60-112-B2]GIU06604.1 hypothetical protein TUM4444_04710 [Shewanella sp. MBTL60-112-B1]GIU26595.1 hypothetical protein TUM4445_05950 [Shewanella sp. MBTL60-112-B2]
MTIMIPTELSQELLHKIAPLQLTHFYFSLVPTNALREKLLIKKLGNIKNMRTLAVSSDAVLRFRELYHERFSAYDRTFINQKPCCESDPLVWPLSHINLRCQQAVKQQLQRLNAQSSFSYTIDLHNNYSGFFKGFSKSSEIALTDTLQHDSDWIKPILKQFCRELTQEHMNTLNPITNYAVLSKPCIEILKLTADGASSREIAKQLHITERGVNYHIDRARDLLGARNRIHLISLAHRHGIFTTL